MSSKSDLQNPDCWDKLSKFITVSLQVTILGLLVTVYISDKEQSTAINRIESLSLLTKQSTESSIQTFQRDVTSLSASVNQQLSTLDMFLRGQMNNLQTSVSTDILNFRQTINTLESSTGSLTTLSVLVQSQVNSVQAVSGQVMSILNQTDTILTKANDLGDLVGLIESFNDTLNHLTLQSLTGYLPQERLLFSGSMCSYPHSEGIIDCEFPLTIIESDLIMVSQPTMATSPQATGNSVVYTAGDITIPVICLVAPRNGSLVFNSDFPGNGKIITISIYRTSKS